MGRTVQPIWGGHHLLTDCVTDYMQFCEENTVPSRKVQRSPNNRSWVNAGIKTLLDDKKRVFTSGDKEELRRVQKELRQEIRKNSFIRKLEQQLEQNNTREVWRGLKKISGCGKGGGTEQVSRDQD